MVELLFGGVSITALGDLFQLEPVMDGTKCSRQEVTPVD